MTQPAAAGPKGKPPHPPRDSLREIAETIVFVVALVLMLKLFVVEAFVIPTGSMAETLFGYNKVVDCPDCGHRFMVNASEEVEPRGGVKSIVDGACCPNCRVRFPMDKAGDPAPGSGDRVLVHKALYHFGGRPTRADVVVFKYPVDPQVKQTAQNYIKRLWGTGEETIAIWRGDLYVARGIDYSTLNDFGEPKYPKPAPGEETRIWEGPAVDSQSTTTPPYQSTRKDFTYHNAEAATAAFERSRLLGFPGGPGLFELVRKPDDVALAMRRIVYDNDHQSAILAKAGVPSRWTAGDGWKPDNAKTPKAFAHTGPALSWVRYRHRVTSPMPALLNQRTGELVEIDADIPPRDKEAMEEVRIDDWDRVAKSGTSKDGMFPPSPVTNFLGYNAGREGGRLPRLAYSNYFVGDLMVECRAKVSGPDDQVVLELSRGVRRFRATFTKGAVTVSVVGPGGRDLATKPTKLTSGGEYDLRFANFDARLRVWVNGSAIDFGGAADYPMSEAAGVEAALGAVAGGAFAPRADGSTLQNDIDGPAAVGAAGAVEVSRVVLWQDTFFTPAENGRQFVEGDDPVDTFYVQPGHYLCLGDNSGQSSDSRKWGLVPERLMLGKAMFVFAPVVYPNWAPRFDRIGFIH